MMIISLVFVPGKTRLTRCAGTCRSQRKQGVNAYLLYHHVYNYVSFHESLEDPNLSCLVPPAGRSWSCRSRPSRTSSKADMSLKSTSGSIKEFNDNN